eukprot:11447285-Alexandrium_andersonii.AAC.1
MGASASPARGRGRRPAACAPRRTSRPRTPPRRHGPREGGGGFPAQRARSTSQRRSRTPLQRGHRGEVAELAR